MAARSRRAHGHPVSDPRLLDVLAVLDGARLPVHYREDVLVDGLRQSQERAVAPVEFPEDSTLSDREVKRLPVDVHQDLLEGFVQVERLTRDVLPVPDDAAVVHVEGERGVGVQGRIGRGKSPARGHPRLGLGGAEINQAQVRIPASGDPHIRPTALLEGQIAPGVATRFTGKGYREGSPELATRTGVMSGDETTLLVEARAAADAVDDLPVGHDRS